MHNWCPNGSSIKKLSYKLKEYIIWNNHVRLGEFICRNEASNDIRTRIN